MAAYGSKETAAKWGKKDPICKALGAFYTVEYTNGRYDYYPVGTWPTESDVVGVLTTYTLCNGKWQSVRNKKH